MNVIVLTINPPTGAVEGSLSIEQGRLDRKELDMATAASSTCCSARHSGCCCSRRCGTPLNAAEGDRAAG